MRLVRNIGAIGQFLGDDLSVPPQFHNIPGNEFLAPPSFDRAVQSNLAPLDEQFGFAPCFDKALKLEELIQANLPRLSCIGVIGGGHRDSSFGMGGRSEN
jgi:hypothetical protein